jgi:hypothetical protein
LLRLDTTTHDVDRGRGKICKLEKKKNKVRTEKNEMEKKKRTQKKCQGRKRAGGRRQR